MKPSVVTVTMNPALDKTVTVESIQIGELNRIQEYRIDPGGKGINVAKVLTNFGIVAAAYGINAGHQGQVLQDKLQDLGIPYSFVQVPGETRTNMKVVDSTSKVTTEFNEPGVPVPKAELDRFTKQFTLGLLDVSVVVLGGSLPPGVPLDYYKQLIQVATDHGVKTILDADGEAFTLGLEASPYAIKPNIHELEAYLGAPLHSDQDIVNAARQLIHTKGVKVVQVSMGGQGSLLVTEHEAFRAYPFPIVPQSTVGAGDSMVAAMVYGLLEGCSMEQLARLTSAAGTITASKPGTQVCTLHEIQTRLHEVRLELVP